MSLNNMESNEQIKDLQALRICSDRVRVWEPYMKKYNCGVVAELGICKGNNFKHFVSHNPKVAVAVDSWVNDKPSRNDHGYTQEQLNQQYVDFVTKMAGNPSIKIYREFTFNIVKIFPDEYFDVVYVDADHTFEGCYRDLVDWYPKVKKGGVILGDDYWANVIPITNTIFGVVEAVDKFVKDNNLTFFLIQRRGWGILK